MHPFHLSPLPKPKPWGGRRLEELGKDLPDGPIGESWEVADLPASIADPGRTLVSTGPYQGRSLRELIDDHRAEVLGSALPWRDGNFPLLIKYLDAHEHLSVQVHPDEDFAARHAGVHTKSESWYVIAAEPGSVIFSGLQEGVTHRDLERAAGSSEVAALLRTVPAVVGELHDIPAGTIHALGAGVLVAEIQTPSDTTFRLYDWVDEYERSPRELHIDLALAATHLDSRPQPVQTMTGGSRHLITTPYYRIDEHRHVDQRLEGGRLSVVMITAGSATVDGSRHDTGTTVVVPASAGPIEIDASDGTLLSVLLTGDNSARHFVVHGRVQGVGFRFWTLRMAQQRGLRGWVRNRSDGTVEVHAEGQPAALDDLERLLDSGPPASSVTRVDVFPATVQPHRSFRVAPTG